jgi:hypothetical protein
MVRSRNVKRSCGGLQFPPRSASEIAQALLLVASLHCDSLRPEVGIAHPSHTIAGLDLDRQLECLKTEKVVLDSWSPPIRW